MIIEILEAIVVILMVCLGCISIAVGVFILGKIISGICYWIDEVWPW